MVKLDADAAVHIRRSMLSRIELSALRGNWVVNQISHTTILRLQNTKNLSVTLIIIKSTQQIVEG